MTIPEELNAATKDEIALHLGREAMARISAQTQARLLTRELARSEARAEDLERRLAPAEPEPPADAGGPGRAAI